MTETKQKRKPRKYTDEFKQQLVDLYPVSYTHLTLPTILRV